MEFQAHEKSTAFFTRIEDSLQELVHQKGNHQRPAQAQIGSAQFNCKLR